MNSVGDGCVMVAPSIEPVAIVIAKSGADILEKLLSPVTRVYASTAP